MIFWKRDCCLHGICNKHIVLCDCLRCDARGKKLKSDNSNNIENMEWTMVISVHYFTINSGAHFCEKKQQKSKSKKKKTKKEIKFLKSGVMMDFILKSFFKDNKLF